MYTTYLYYTLLYYIPSFPYYRPAGEGHRGRPRAGTGGRRTVLHGAAGAYRYLYMCNHNLVYNILCIIIIIIIIIIRTISVKTINFYAFFTRIFYGIGIVVVPGSGFGQVYTHITISYIHILYLILCFI